jgi:hypothetical protein
MFSSKEGLEGVEMRKEAMKKMIPPEVELTSLGKKILSLESW